MDQGLPNLGAKAIARHERDIKVKEAFDKSKQRNGARRLQVEHAENGDPYNTKLLLTVCVAKRWWPKPPVNS